MKLPTEVDVVGLIYQVQEVDVVNKAILGNGEIDLQERIITIDKGLSSDRRKIVLLHEIIHAETKALRLDGICNDEDAVQNLTAALYHAFKHPNLTFPQMI